MACLFFFHPDLPLENIQGITVGAVIPTARAFRLADYTADRDFHPALKICGCKYINYFQIIGYTSLLYPPLSYNNPCSDGPHLPPTFPADLRAHP